MKKYLYFFFVLLGTLYCLTSCETEYVHEYKIINNSNHTIVISGFDIWELLDSTSSQLSKNDTVYAEQIILPPKTEHLIDKHKGYQADFQSSF